MAGNPFDQFGGGNAGSAVFTLPGSGPKPPSGYGAPGATPIAAVPGGPEDPATVARLQGIKTNIDVGGQIAAARARGNIDLANQLTLLKARQDADKGTINSRSGQVEEKRYTALQDQGQIARELINQFTRGFRLSQSTPTGAIPGAIGGIKRAFGASGVPTQAREQMDALGNQMVMSFRQPGTGSVSDAERESFRRSLFNSSYLPETNAGIIDAQMATQLRQLGQSRLASIWKAKYGSLDKTAPNGMNFDDTYQAMLSSPEMRMATRPISERVNEHPVAIDYNGERVMTTAPEGASPEDLQTIAKLALERRYPGAAIGRGVIGAPIAAPVQPSAGRVKFLGFEGQ